MTTPRRDLVCLTLLWWAGAALRITILAVPPLILLITGELHLSATELGVLSGLPMAMLAIAALPGSLLIARLGSRTALICGLLVVAAGAALRGLSWNVISLYATTIIMSAGVAVMQPAMPVLVREWLPSRIGFATAIYSNGLLLGETIVIFLTGMFLPLLAGNWRLGLAIWSLPVVATAAAVIVFAPPSRSSPPGSEKPPVWWPDWSDPLILRLGVLFGSVNALYFATNAFLPPLLNSIGRSDLVQYALTALNFGQLPASLLLTVVAQKLERRAWPYLCVSLVSSACIIGLVFMSGAWIIFWAGLLGFSIGSSLVLGLTLPPLLVEREQVGPTSAAMFTLSYSIGVAVALLSGVASDLAGNSVWAFLPIGICTLTLGASALMLRAQGKLR
ncbi:MAG: MFS transporter [Rhodomicrobium sp.]